MNPLEILVLLTNNKIELLFSKQVNKIHCMMSNPNNVYYISVFFCTVIRLSAFPYFSFAVKIKTMHNIIDALAHIIIKYTSHTNLFFTQLQYNLLSLIIKDSIPIYVIILNLFEQIQSSINYHH